MNLGTILFYFPLVASKASELAEKPLPQEEGSSSLPRSNKEKLGQVVHSSKPETNLAGQQNFDSVCQWIQNFRQLAMLSTVTSPKPDLVSGSFTPLRADEISRSFSAYEILPLSKDRPLQKVDYEAMGTDGTYTIRLEIPDGLFSDDERNQLIAIVEEINRYSGKPLTLIRWDNEKEAGHYYPPQPGRGQYLSMGWVVTNPARDDLGFTKSILTHEMMHSLYEANFKGDQDFREIIYPFLLGAKNYEIIDDSNFEPGIHDAGGHPYAKPHEAFASAAAAYYGYADKLVAFIQNPDTPNAMKVFGKLVWCFMRDRVFSQVYTSDGADPFAEESLDQLLKVGKGARTKSLLLALDDEEPTVRWRAEDLIRGNPKVLDMDLLKEWRKAHPNHRSHGAIDIALLALEVKSF